MIEYPEDTPFQDFSQEKTRRIGLSTKAIDIARYKSIDAVVLRPMLLNDQLGPAIEIPFDTVREVCEEMIDVAEAERPVEAFEQALPLKRVELTTEEYGRLKDLVGETTEFIERGDGIGHDATLRKALQAVLDLGLE